MECDVCEKPGRKKFFCETCLNERLLIHNSSLKRLAAAHEATVKRALQLLKAPEGVQERRLLKARRAALIVQNKNLEAHQKYRNDQIETRTAVLQSKKKELASRRARLQEAQRQIHYQRSTRCPHSELASRTSSETAPRQIASIQQHWDRVLKSLVEVRRNLISELFSIYTITANDRPPSHQNGDTDLTDQSSVDASPGCNFPSARIEWRILGLCLPVSTEIQLHHHDEVSAAALYASHFLRLAAMYLGIKLPFQMVMGPVLSVRVPRYSVWSNKHSSPYPLHLPTSVASVSSSSGLSTSHIAFLTGLCMLSYNALYLLSTQRPISFASSESSRNPQSSHLKPTELLQNLHLCCQSRQLGWSSHVTGKTRLPVLNDPSHFPQADLQAMIKEVLDLKHQDAVDEEWSIV